MEGFVGDETFELDSLLNGEPVLVCKDWGDVIFCAGVGEQTSTRVLDVLCVEYFGECAVQNAVAVVKW